MSQSSSETEQDKFADFDNFPNLLTMFKAVSDSGRDTFLHPMIVTPEMVVKNDQHLIDFLMNTQQNIHSVIDMLARLMTEMAVQLNLRPNFSKIQKELLRSLKPQPGTVQMLEKNLAEQVFNIRKLVEEAKQTGAAGDQLSELEEESSVDGKGKLSLADKTIQKFENLQQVIAESPLYAKVQDSDKRRGSDAMSPGLISAKSLSEPKQSQSIFISDTYFNLLYDDIKHQQQNKFNKMFEMLEKNIQKCEKFFDFAQVQIPKIKEASLLACAQQRQVTKCMESILIRNFKMSTIRDIWKVLKLNKQRENRKKKVQIKIIINFRRQFLFINFKRWRETAKKMREVSMPDTLRGTQIQLQEFKQKLSMFDVALQHIKTSKIDRAGLDGIMSKHRVANKDVYSEMANLFDLQIQKVSKDFQRLK